MRRRFTLGVLVLAPAAAAAVALPHPVNAASHDQGGGAAECTIAISMNPVAPGVSYVPGEATYKLSGFTDCMSTDPGLTHGTFTGTGSGIVGCIGGLRDATLMISWNNGQTSTEKLQFGEFLYGGGAEGTVTGGEFAGNMVAMALERRTGGGEARCVSGFQSYGMAGEMGILGSGGGSGGGGSDNPGGGSGSTPPSGAPSTGAGGPAGASAAPPSIGAVRASANVPATGTSTAPSIPATGAASGGLVAGLGLLSAGVVLLARSLRAGH